MALRCLQWESAQFEALLSCHVRGSDGYGPHGHCHPEVTYRGHLPLATLRNSLSPTLVFRIGTKKETEDAEVDGSVGLSVRVGVGGGFLVALGRPCTSISLNDF